MLYNICELGKRRFPDSEPMTYENIVFCKHRGTPSNHIQLYKLYIIYIYYILPLTKKRTSKGGDKTITLPQLPRQLHHVQLVQALHAGDSLPWPSKRLQLGNIQRSHQIRNIKQLAHLCM